MRTTKLDEYDIIIFDCDGVLIDINLLKCEAFGKAVEGYPAEVVERFVNHCKKTFGVSRYVKFKEFLHDFAMVPFQDEKYHKLVNDYANICKDIYRSADLTEGSEDLLLELSISNKCLYVASGSDEEELNEVFNTRNLRKYFNGIYGSPKTKQNCVSIILGKHPNKKVVLIGDALSDMKTAKALGIDFVYMSKYSVQSEEQDLLCREEAKAVVNTLEELMNTSQESEHLKFI